MRLDKYLADMGCGTRSELRTAVQRGRVTVGGTVVRDPGFGVTEADEVRLDGKPVAYQSVVYIMMNKPAGVISATTDPRQKTVIDLINDQTRRDIFPAGRLDVDTEGLLLLTNDGKLSHSLLSPKRHVAKTYFVRLDKPVTGDAAARFEAGLEIGGPEPFTAMPAGLTILRNGDSLPDGTLFTAASGEGAEVLVTLREGKYHQIKRMFAAVGREVVYLKRLSMGPLILDKTLKPGQYRALTEEETARLKAL